MSESEPKPSHALTVVPPGKPLRISRAVAADIVVPAIVADAGDQWEAEEIAAALSNRGGTLGTIAGQAGRNRPLT
ncbi:MAG: hypothetical protein ABSC06_32630 [Rhodopila sp.]